MNLLREIYQREMMEVRDKLNAKENDLHHMTERMMEINRDNSNLKEKIYELETKR